MSSTYGTPFHLQVEKKRKQPPSRVKTTGSNWSMDDQTAEIQEPSVSVVQDEGPPSKKQCLEEDKETAEIQEPSVSVVQNEGSPSKKQCLEEDKETAEIQEPSVRDVQNEGSPSKKQCLEEDKETAEIQEPSVCVVQDEGSPSKKQCLEEDKETNPTTAQVNELHHELNMRDEKIKSLEKKLKSLKKKLKSSQQKSRRLKKKVTSMKEIVKSLKKQDLISTSYEEMLNQAFSSVPLGLMKRMAAKKSGKGWRYSPELKSFALTLQFYSAKAYEFVRKTFNIALPSQSQIRRWYGKVAADPGFTQPAF